MAYTPKSEAQLADEGLTPEGIYDYEIVEAEEKLSKAGNDMYVLKLYIFDQNGIRRPLTDYIALGSNFGERKLRHAADASGILDIYESGDLCADSFIGKCGKVVITKQDGTVEYPNPKNVVKDYVKREGQPAKKAVDLKDHIPF
jgi:hypothetical protein